MPVLGSCVVVKPNNTAGKVVPPAAGITTVCETGVVGA